MGYQFLLQGVFLTQGSNPCLLHWQTSSLPLSHQEAKWNIQFSSVTQSCPTLCDPMDCSTPGLPVHHQLPEFTQTHVHWVGDAIQPSHPLSSPSPPAPNPSQHQGLFQWVNSSHEVAKVLEFQLQQYYSAIKRMKFCHLQKCRWNWRVSCLVNSEKDGYPVTTYIWNLKNKTNPKQTHRYREQASGHLWGYGMS